LTLARLRGFGNSAVLAVFRRWSPCSTRELFRWIEVTVCDYLGARVRSVLPNCTSSFLFVVELIPKINIVIRVQKIPHTSIVFNLSGVKETFMVEPERMRMSKSC
jgi:hypothetical protein